MPGERINSIWPLRLLLLTYIFYKMFLSGSNDWMMIKELENKDHINISGRVIGHLFFVFGTFFLFGLLYFYQIRQILVEVGRSVKPINNKVRMYSIIFASTFFLLSSVSLFNVNLSNTSLVEYLIEFYTVFTSISVTASVIVIVRDIKLFTQERKIKARVN